MKRMVLLIVICCMVLGLAACSQESGMESKSRTEADNEDTAAADLKEAADGITEDQAYEAVRKYYYTQNPGLEDPSSEGEAQAYWDVSTDENNKIIVLYRSYTGALIRFYIDPETGETYITEQVPGIIDDEQRTDETFNVKDYL